MQGRVGTTLILGIHNNRQIRFGNMAAKHFYGTFVCVYAAITLLNFCSNQKTNSSLASFNRPVDVAKEPICSRSVFMGVKLYFCKLLNFPNR